MQAITKYLSFIILVFLFASCGSRTNSNNQPIVLGDSSTIITETDSQYLKDNISEIEFATPDSNATNSDKDSSSTNVVDTIKVQSTADNIKGFKIDIGNTTFVFTNLNAKELSPQDPQKNNGASYAITSGNLSTSKLVVTNASNVSVQQRYQSALSLKNSLGTLSLDHIGFYTSDWQKLNGSVTGSNVSFNFNGLNNPQFSSINNSRIKSAAQIEMRSKRMSRHAQNQWMKEIRTIRSIKDKGCIISINNVQWIISGTDSKGKSFRKTVRMDL